ncbi:unnamed protein product [Moneuplotes crassus]|uniref:Uncharacterized protein n=1 Tax=Euplotes crassus TaxID=5936 RepID=A0AAD2D6G9_EUPCR|nr:unnamed protein product [Moneuplotes crassus]
MSTLQIPFSQLLPSKSSVCPKNGLKIPFKNLAYPLLVILIVKTFVFTIFGSSNLGFPPPVGGIEFCGSGLGRVMGWR